MKPCLAKQRQNIVKTRNRQTMNPGEVITTEINTEIRVEVQLETASILKVESNSSNLKTSVNNMISTQDLKSEKTIDKITAEHNSKKLAKQARKIKPCTVVASDAIFANSNEITTALPNAAEYSDNKNRDQIKAVRDAKKLAKQKAKAGKTGSSLNIDRVVANQLNQLNINEAATTKPDVSGGDKKKPTLTKAERRAIQESQRAAKSQVQQAVPKSSKSGASRTASSTTRENEVGDTFRSIPIKQSSALIASEARFKKRARSKSPVKTVRFNNGNVKLFSHLEKPNTDLNLFLSNIQIHPSVVRLGEQYAKRTIVGCNARCLAFLNAIKTVIQDYETPAKKEFIRSLESFIVYCVKYLQNCRTLAVSVINAHRRLKQVLIQLPKDEPESELKGKLFTFIDTYIENQIGKAAQAINSVMQKKINNGDVILTFGCSSLINYICEEAKARKVDFRVIVVDSRPFCEGQELLRRLAAKTIPCSYVLINAVSFVMPEVTKVLLGAHALLANGYVMARAGTAQVALVARSFNVPVLVCCETHKFSERVQTDAIVFNELGNPDDIVVDEKCCLSNWQAKYKMSPLNLNYDITPPKLVTAVITEVSVLPCTSVPVILRMKPDWLV